MDLSVGERVKKLRESKGISTNKLSTLAGLSQSYVRKLERGESNPSVESLELICEALGISLIDFLNNDNEQESLNRLKAINIVRKLSDAQLEGFCRLMYPFEEKDS